jgi:hypothetical protein
MKSKRIVYTNKSVEKFLIKKMKESSDNKVAYVRRGTFQDEIIWGSSLYRFSKLSVKKRKAFNKGMFLFGMVRKDAKLYLKEHPIIKLPKKYNQVEYSNKPLPDDHFQTITGTDLNHAYWRIAYNLGIISEITYLKGLNPDFKSVRLAALSTMGAPKKYQVMKQGELTEDYKVLVRGDEQLQNVYKLIRYTCYRYMNQVKKLLGKDFLAYKTDAIYYIDTKENRKLVRDFFKEKNLSTKQLQ